MQFKVSNNDLIQVSTGEIRARVIMLNMEATRFGIMYGVINEMSEDEIMQYVDTYSGLNGIYATEELAMAHAIASVQPVPQPFDHQEAVYQNSGYARQIAGETPEMAHARHEAVEAAEAEKPNQWRYLWFGIYLVRVNSERLQIQCEDGTDLSGSDNLQVEETDNIIDYTDYDKKRGPTVFNRFCYAPNADGKYRLVVDLKIGLEGQPVIWEFIIDAVGNCTRKRI